MNFEPEAEPAESGVDRGEPGERPAAFKPGLQLGQGAIGARRDQPPETGSMPRQQQRTLAAKAARRCASRWSRPIFSNQRHLFQ
jgi:hypothetical protein